MKTVGYANNNITEDKPFRIHRSLCYDDIMGEFRRVSGDSVTESIVADICFHHQFDIFGFSLLDQETFGVRMGYSKSYLRQKHPAPFQSQTEGAQLVSSFRKRQHNEIDGNALRCDDRIQNALYVLTHYAVSLHSILETDGKLVQIFDTYTILDKFYVIQDEKTGKVRYGYHVNEKFLLALNRFFLYVDMNSLLKLRASGLGGLYCYLTNVAQAVYAEGRVATTIENTPSFAKLCKLAGIRGEIPKYNKRHLQDALKKIAKETDLKFTVTWLRGKGKQAYTPIFTFIPRRVDHVKNGFQWGTRFDDSEMMETLVLELKHNLYTACPKGDNPFSIDAEKVFFTWIKGLSEADEENIRRILSNTFYRAGCEIPRDIESRVKHFIWCANNKSTQEFDSWLTSVFSYYSSGFRYRTIPLERM